MIEDLLRRDAAAWQRDLDGGARPRRRRHVDWRPLAAVAAVLLVALGALVVAGRSHPADPAARLSGVRWVDPASGNEMIFSEHHVRIDRGCFTVELAVAVTARSLDVRLVHSPDVIACVPEFVPSAASDRFNQLVRGRLGYERSGSTLRLTRNSVSIALHAKPVLRLAGTRWVMTSPVRGLRLLIGADGTVRAGDGCETVTGRARITRSILLFASTIVFDTKVGACMAPVVSPTTRKIDIVLTGTADARIRRDTLTLTVGGDPLVHEAR